jgi:hypothetical protein
MWCQEKLVVSSFVIPFYYGQGSLTQKVTVRTVPVPQHWLYVDIDQSNVFLKNICCAATQTTL